jgi:ceramide glucosyltransferase
MSELFTKTTALAIALWIVAPDRWEFAALALLFRAGAQWATGIWVLEDPQVARCWWLLPIEDVASFVTWVLGFFGKTIVWRGRKLVLARDGSFEM